MRANVWTGFRLCKDRRATTCSPGEVRAIQYPFVIHAVRSSIAQRPGSSFLSMIYFHLTIH